LLHKHLFTSDQHKHFQARVGPDRRSDIHPR
jgi:hypothetical protein